jgi:hypothetical protein
MKEKEWGGGGGGGEGGRKMNDFVRVCACLLESE